MMRSLTQYLPVSCLNGGGYMTLMYVDMNGLSGRLRRKDFDTNPVNT